MASQGGTESACAVGFHFIGSTPTGGALRSRLLISYSRIPIRPWRGAGDGDGSGEPCLSGDGLAPELTGGRAAGAGACRMQIEVEMSGTQVRVGIGINRNRKMDI